MQHLEIETNFIDLLAPFKLSTSCRHFHAIIKCRTDESLLEREQNYTECFGFGYAVAIWAMRILVYFTHEKPSLLKDFCTGRIYGEHSCWLR